MSGENSFGDLLRHARERIGWTQQEVADKFEEAVNRVTVNRWEKGVQRPSAHYFRQLINILDLNEQEAYTLYYAGGKTPPERHNLPRPNRFFTGREGYLKELRELLETDCIVALSGLGGIGKTQIALQYAHRYHPDVYPTALWVNAADTTTLEADFAYLAELLKLPEQNKDKLDWRVKAVKKWLKEHTNWLLVMDNADELPVVEPFLLSRPRGHIVLTTRWQFPGKLARPLAIEAMVPEEGLPFLYKRSGVEQTGAEDAVGRQIVKVLGGHALALEQAGAYIQETGISFADYLKLCEDNRRPLLDQYGALGEENSEHPLTVAATFRAGFEKAHALHPLAEDILYFCAFLQPDEIPEELFQHDENFKYGTTAFNKAIAALQRYSLIKRSTINRNTLWEDLYDEKILSMHRLVQTVLIDDMSPDLRRQWRDRVVQALIATLPENTWGRNVYMQRARLWSHVLACAMWTEDELNSTIEVAMLFKEVGIDLLARRSYLGAKTLFTRALTICMQLYGVNHLVTASALINLAYFINVRTSTSGQCRCIS